jgi:hypothetical protein
MNVDELKPGDRVIMASGMERTVKQLTPAYVHLTAANNPKKTVKYWKSHATIKALRLKDESTNGNGNGEVEAELLLPKCTHNFILAYYATHPDELVNGPNVVNAFSQEIYKVLR